MTIAIVLMGLVILDGLFSDLPFAIRYWAFARKVDKVSA